MDSTAYLQKLGALNVDQSSGHPKPHKVCLLLAVLDLVESGEIKENKIEITESLQKAYNAQFEKFRSKNDQANMHLPFFHLFSEGFWHFVNKENVELTSDEIKSLKPSSLKQLQAKISYVRLDQDLWDACTQGKTRQAMRTALMDNLNDMSEQFERWLGFMGKSEKTTQNYLQAITTSLSNWALEDGIAQQSLITIPSHHEFSKIMMRLMATKKFITTDKTGHGMYSAALKSYQKFLSQNCQADVSEDIDEILMDDSKTTTEKNTLVKARVGQGKFREDLIQYWKRCALTGYRSTAFLVASHIKPWRASADDERLDQYNGLLLLANIDKAFDLGFITFDEDGGIILSQFIEQPELLGLHKHLHITLAEPHQEYMHYHRAKVFEHSS